MEILKDRVQRWMFTLYLGLEREIDDALQAELDGLIRPFTPSFTLLAGLGCFAGSKEHTHLIQIAVEEKQTAYACAEELRKHYDQEAVGCVCNGQYERILKK